jgi:putative endopeptidase
MLPVDRMRRSRSKAATLALGILWTVGCLSPAGVESPIVAIDRTDMDLAVSPGEDFYQYANGSWLKRNPIPSGHDTWGTFAVLRQQNADVLRALLEASLGDSRATPGSPSQLLRDFYRAAMDTRAIDEAGQTPLDPYFRLIDRIQTADGLAAAIGELHRSAAPQAAFLFYRDVDVNTPQLAIAALKQGGIALPNRSYYLDQTGEAAAVRDRYRRHLRAMFGLLGQDDAAATANADIVMRVETIFARHSMTPEQERDPNLTFHKMRLEDLQRRFPSFSWTSYFRALGLPANVDINVVTPGFFSTMSEMVEQLPLTEWKVYLKWNTLTTNAPLLGAEFVRENFDFFGRTLTGVVDLPPRWRRVLAQTESSLGWALAREYVKQYFSPRAKEAMLRMIGDIRATFRGRIANLDWMSRETRTKALAKLDGIVVNIGYPDRWPDFSDLHIASQGYVANVARSTAHQVARDIGKLGRAVDRSDFGMTPQQVNAYYSPPENKIVFPAGILQPPFFHESFDEAVNYGAIGSVIAHEFTHAFDDEGSHYDASGRLSNWWTNEDSQRFRAKRQLLIDQYDSYIVLDDLRLNGALTVGENLADLGGVSVAFQAFQRRQATNGRAKDIDGFTPEQRFFIAWARLWRVNKTPGAIRLQVKTSTTTYYPFRVIGPLSNLPEFADAFALNASDRMVRDPGQRVRIW